jgi:hypothetical protein
MYSFERKEQVTRMHCFHLYKLQNEVKLKNVLFMDIISYGKTIKTNRAMINTKFRMMRIECNCGDTL